MKERHYPLRVPLTTEQVTARPAWEPHGLIIANYCDAVVRVDDGRGGVWRVPSGKTIRRLLIYPTAYYTAKTETEATSGEALVILTEEAITDIAGDTVDVSNLFRREVYYHEQVVAPGSAAADVPVAIGAARRMQIICTFVVNDPAGFGLLRVYDTTDGIGLTRLYHASVRIPDNRGDLNGTTIVWRMGEGWDMPLPIDPHVEWQIYDTGGVSGTSIQMSIYVWE